MPSEDRIRRSGRSGRPRGRQVPAAVLSCLLLAALASAFPASAAAGSPKVLLVGSYHGVAGRFATIQAAVDAARPGDWILIGPGDYRTRGPRTTRTSRRSSRPPAC